nr:beta-galactosidase [Snuella sedimenti]
MGHPGRTGEEIKVNSLYLTKGGEPMLPVMGEFHFSRYDHRYWKETLLKMKASGVNIVSTYLLWIYHEEIEGQLDWTGNNNIRAFVELCQEVGLLVHLRIGPYCNAECRNGGLPDWLMKKTHIRKRYNDPLYLAYSQNWYKAIYKQVEGLLYKDGGPIMGVQLENEYVTKGHVVPHLMALKKMAVEVGFDTPLYSMTHWMASDYPKKDVIPYAGYYIETPWTRGYDELPVGNFEFFSYNRLSDNIGTDLITIEGGVQSLNSKEVESPYFTCEVGLGTPSFYHRRPVVPEEMAGENINLRLGCGVNLMGYYMYSGGSHKIGELTTLESSTSRVSYDYQAPLKEFGTLGAVMNETKKYNYFMNDFGSDLAPMVAYLPTSNNNTDNLQWAVRSKNGQGFLFCSNYLYKKKRKAYKDVQFQVKLNNETLQIPRKPITIQDGAYFLWPFNMALGDVQLKYATAQPICKLNDKKTNLWVFFEDDAIPAEYVFNKALVKKVTCTNGMVKEEKHGYFVSQLKPGTNCVIEVEQTDGTILKILTLTGAQSDAIWKLKAKGQDYLVLSESGVFLENNTITTFSESNETQLLVFPNLQKATNKDGIFSEFKLREAVKEQPVALVKYRPMEQAHWVRAKSAGGKSVIRKSVGHTAMSKVKMTTIRCAGSAGFTLLLNGTPLELVQNGNYFNVPLPKEQWQEHNTIQIESVTSGLQFIGEIEILLENGSRLTWQTDNTWESGTDKIQPVEVLGKQGTGNLPQFAWKKEDRLAYYEVKLLKPLKEDGAAQRLYISFVGDRADAFLGETLFSDYLFDGTPWIIGLDRFIDGLQGNPIVLRVEAFNTNKPEIYFEKNVDTSEIDTAQIKNIEIKPEYRFYVNLD